MPSGKLKKLPVFRKADEITQIVIAIMKYIPPEKDKLQLRGQMLSYAGTMGAKIAGAEGGDLYFIRMECAVQIKVAARELQALTNLLREDNLCPEEYIQVLRSEIDAFRLLFIDWVAGFDKTNGRDDEWGELFA